MIGDVTKRTEERGTGVSDAICVPFRGRKKKQDWSSPWTTVVTLDDSRYRRQAFPHVKYVGMEKTRVGIRIRQVSREMWGAPGADINHRGIRGPNPRM